MIAIEERGDGDMSHHPPVVKVAAKKIEIGQQPADSNYSGRPLLNSRLCCGTVVSSLANHATRSGVLPAFRTISFLRPARTETPVGGAAFLVVRQPVTSHVWEVRYLIRPSRSADELAGLELVQPSGAAS